MSTRIFFRGNALHVVSVLGEPHEPFIIADWLTTKELRASLIAMALVPAVAVLAVAYVVSGAPLHLLGALCGGWLAVDSWREARLAHWFREHGCQRSAPDAGGAS